MQAGEVGVLTILYRTVDLGSLPLCTAFFFFALFLQAGLLTVPLSGCGFAWSSDDALLPGVTCPSQVYCEAAPCLRVEIDDLDAGFKRLSFERERESVSRLKP